MSHNHISQPVRGKVKMETDYVVRKYRGSMITGECKAKNLILNGMFDRLLNSLGADFAIKGVIFGAGTTAPSETQTSLVSYLGGGNSFQAGDTIVNSTVSPRSVTRWCTIRCAEGAVVGNVAELAIYLGSVGGSEAPSSGVTIGTRARITDEGGSPTVISVASDEFLEVTFFWTVYVMDGSLGTLTINLLGTPTEFDYEIRPIAMQNPSLGAGQWLNASTPQSVGSTGLRMGFYIGSSNDAYMSSVASATSFFDPSATTDPTGSNISTNKFTSIIDSTYTPGSKSRLFTLRLPLNNGNIASPGIRSFYLVTGYASQSIWFAHQVLLDGPFQKVSGQIFDMPISVTLGNS